jgi:hypothetical protein
MTAALPDSGARTTAAVGVVVGLLGVTVHLVAVAAVLVWGSTTGLPGRPRLWPVLGFLAALVLWGLFGTAVARLHAGLLTPLLAMAAWVAVVFLLRASGGNELIDLGGVSVVLVGLAPDTVAVLWRAAWLIAAGALVWALAAQGRRALRRPAFLVLVPLAAVLAFATVSTADDGFVRVPVGWACDAGPPKVCVAEEYEDRLEDYAAAVGRMAPLAEEVGLPVPGDGYRQTVGVRPGTGSFNVDARVNTGQLAFDLVQFGLPCSVDWDLEDLERADAVAAWMVAEAGGTPRPGTAVPDLAGARKALASLRCDG